MNALTSQVEAGAGPSMSSSSIVLTSLRKTFVRRSGEEVHAIDDVTLEIEPGEFLVLLGPSGCGKTTLLRSVAGLEVPTSGRITIEGKPYFDSDAGHNVPPELRHIGMIFQSYALWPHMTVFKNVAYPLRTQGVDKTNIESAVNKTLELVGIPELADQYPGQISGGQQQRVALARALVAGTKVVLFDEPLSNVDAKVREQLRLEIKRMHKELGFTAVYVTHDQEEAMALATRIAVLHQGQIAQLGTPAEIYEEPESLIVGRFIGQLNELRGEVEQASATDTLVRTSIGAIRGQPLDGVEPGDEVIVGVRPEDLSITGSDAADGAENCWSASIELAVYLGTRREYLVDVEGVELKLSDKGPAREPGSLVTLVAEPAKVHVYLANDGGAR